MAFQGCKALAALFALLLASVLVACPFCDQTGKTLSREVADAKVVVFGTLSNPVLKFGKDGSEQSTTDLSVEEIIKDHEYLRGKKKLVLQRYLPLTGEPVKFLIFADIYKEKLDDYRGIASNTKELVKYLQGAVKLPEKAVAARLVYFLGYLDHADSEISMDAYREFAAADYEEVVAAIRAVDPEKLRAKLIGWLKDKDTAPFRFGFYGMLLGLVGKPEDGALFLELLEDPDRGLITGIDGMMAGYARVDREQGWAYLLRQMEDPALPYARRYAALRSVRFLWKYQPDVVPRKELLRGMRALLDQSDLADLATDDLRKLKAWDFTDDILACFSKETHQLPQIRRAILRYAMQCPGEKAKAFLAEQKKANPKLVEQVEEFLKLELPDS